uniref:TRAF3-interacting protein 1 n=1 Tax=Ciona savignyi TaxID=51511 RepID=H2YVY2_CIOSA
NMDPKIIKKTKDSMGTIIKKPPLTDKLLNKPPFRFLHDIITEVIRTSGFLKGLFTNEEMESKNVTAKEDKLLFLQKVIDCVNIVSGDTLTVKPNKVIAGHEPEKTNELLQVMAKCILKNKSSTDAVQQVLTGKSSKSKSKEKPPSGSKRSEIGEKDEKEDTGKERKKKGDRSSEHRDRSQDKRRPSADHERRKERERSSDNRHPENSEEPAQEPEHGRKRRKSKKHQDENENPNGNSEPSGSRGETEEQPDKDNTVGLRENAEGAESSTPTRAPRPASAKGQRRKPYGGRSKPDVQQEGHEEPSVTSRKLTRPPSARPAAPRVRQRPNAAEEEHRSAPIIVDRNLGTSPSDDDDEQFVVEDADPMQPEEHTHVPNGSQLDDGEEHGGLVRKILETKKELEQSAAGQNKAEKHTEIQRTNRELVVKEIDQLRNSVQTLCQSATPLAKIIDYIQEDMDAMQNELVFWKKENAEHATKLKEEENITARAVEPLKHELEELDRSLSTYRNQMAATKANIIRNQEKIQKMVSAV